MAPRARDRTTTIRPVQPPMSVVMGGRHGIQAAFGLIAAFVVILTTMG